MSQSGETVDPGESILRRIFRKEHYDPSLAIPVLAAAFRPRDDDTDGISVYRELLCSVLELLNSARQPPECYVVARFKAADLLALGLSLVPTQTDDGPLGHVSIPELRREAYKNKDTKPWVLETNQKLAVLAKDIIEGHRDMGSP
jgi:hypothetical protein